MNICIYGAARNQINKSYIEAGETFGHTLAQKGHNLIFGGGAGGMMGAAARGALAVEPGSPQGCRIIAVAPAGMNVDDEEFQLCTEFRRTADLAERKRIFIEMADAFVVMPGGFGTYDEFFDLISVKRLMNSEAEGKPVALYNVNGYFESLRAMIAQSVKEGFIAEWTGELYRICSDADELWNYLENVDESKKKTGYPEECCDSSEISDQEFDAYWRRVNSGSLWRSAIQSSASKSVADGIAQTIIVE